MNSRTNNTAYRPLHAVAPYEGDDDHVPRMVHVSIVSLRPGSTIGVVGPMDPFGSGAYVSPFTLPRVRSQPAMQNQARDTTMPRAANPSPRLVNNISDPLLRGNQQDVGLEKLRREIYNPGIQRVSLYYRDYDSRAKARENEDGKSCVICLDDFEPREMVTLTPCNHMFHEHCIVPWVKSHGQCPVCRFVIVDHSKENEGRRTIINSELVNDPFARDLVSFIRDMEARG
ncbi:uncharacterized protein LOC143623216 [Bidens hawaiensis]|uniref:uncharacterized protein LOC143623216 n=1 Tax=Bidens hawaiensis TaxID=980011 RepID=UPI00404A17D5